MHNYSDNLNKALEFANNLALRYSELTNNEHLLYGLSAVEGSTSKKILEKLLLTEKIISSKIANNPRRRITDIPGLTSSSVKALSTALYLARQDQSVKITTTHLLLAIASDKQTLAHEILKEYKITFEQINKVAKSYTRDKRDLFSEIFDINYLEDKNNEYEDLFLRIKKKDDTSSHGQPSEEDILLELGRYITDEAKEGIIDPVIGRDMEIKRIIQIMSRRKKNNPMLIGEPGVGKTAIAEGLALAIVNNAVPEMLKGKRVYSLNIASLVAGTKYRGEFEQRLKKAIEKIAKEKIILFIDEIHTIVKAGDSEGGTTAANILKPLLTTGKITLIGATTIDEFRKYIETDPALERRFQTLIIEPPSVDETIEILKGLKSKYEEHHKVSISNEAIEAAAKLSDRYIMDRFLPDKAIDLIDEACSKKVNESFTSPAQLKELEDKILQLDSDISKAALNQDYAKAYYLQEERNPIIEELEKKKAEWSEVANQELVIGAEEIAEVVSLWSKIPVHSITEEESEKLKKLNSKLKEQVIGQDKAITAVANAIKRGRSGIKDPNKPIGSFIFIGPTGVGKTELAKALARTVFGDENLMIRLDMSEYMDKINTSKLIGSAPGYVGYDEGGQLTEQIRRKPYSVVLFDEIEKAHPEVFNILLQVLDDGRLTDSKGRLVSFKNTIVIMTSNIGASVLSSNTKVGFGDVDETNIFNEMKEKQLTELKKIMRPEFLNRVDEIITFQHLEEKSLLQIIDILLSRLNNILEDKNIKLIFDEKVHKYILEKGTNLEYGARPLKRAITQYIENALSDKILSGEVLNDSTVRVYVDNKNKIDFKNEIQA